MIKFKIKEASWTPTSALPQTNQGLTAPPPPSPPRISPVFLKLLCPNFIWIRHCHSTYYSNIATYHSNISQQHNIAIVREGIPAPLFLRHPLLAWPSLPPLLKIFVSPPLFSVPPPFKVFQTVPPSLSQPSSALIQPPTNLPWFKQISKGLFYQFNCRFLSKINF